MKLSLMKKLLQYVNEVTSARRDYTRIGLLQHELMDACDDDVHKLPPKAPKAPEPDYQSEYFILFNNVLVIQQSLGIPAQAGTVDMSRLIRDVDMLVRKIKSLQGLARASHDNTLPVLRETIANLLDSNRPPLPEPDYKALYNLLAERVRAMQAMVTPMPRLPMDARPWGTDFNGLVHYLNNTIAGKM